jgi:DNA-binding LacI/PurR family transcriptional regulator
LSEGSSSPHNRGFDLAGPDNVDAVILTAISTALDQPRVSQLVARFDGIPRCTLGIRLPDIPYVQADNHRGLRAVVMHLARQHGCEKIAYLTGPEANPEAQLRLRVYRETLDQLRVPYDAARVAHGEFSEQGGRQAMLELIRRGVDFDAVVGGNDHSALGALRVLAERRIRVPEQVAVAGFDDIPEASAVSPPLTTVRQAWRPQAEAALDIVLGQLAGDPAPEGVTVRAPMVIRRSCGCLSEVARSAALGSAETRVISFERALQLAGQALAPLSRYVDAEPGWEQELVQRFERALDGSETAFLEALDLYVTTSTGEVNDDWNAWQQALSRMRRAIVPALTTSQQRVRAEDVWHQARVVVAEATARRASRVAIEAERSARTLAAAAEALIARFDVKGLPTVLVEQLALLGIESCFLALYARGGPRAEHARLALSYKHGKVVELSDAERRVSTRSLLPKALWEGEPVLVVEPLFFQDVELGFVVLEFGKQRGAIYEGLRQLLSATLQGAVLAERLSRQSAPPASERNA